MEIKFDNVKSRLVQYISNFHPFFRRHKIISPILNILPGSTIQTVKFNEGALLLADLLDPNPREYFLRKRYEPEFFKIATPFLSNGGVFFDIGSNWGFCSFGLMSALETKGGTVDYHLFEANKNICDVLVLSAKLNNSQRTYINNCCVTNLSGTSKLKVSPRQSGESFISENGETVVKNLVLDEYIFQNKIEKIDFMKIDIEGWEPLAIKGASKSLSQGKIDVIYTEFIPSHLSRAKYSAKSYGQMLQNFGFDLFDCDQTELNTSNKSVTIKINDCNLDLTPLDISNMPPKIHSGVQNVLAIKKDILQKAVLANSKMN